MIFQLAVFATPSLEAHPIGRKVLMQYDLVKLIIGRAQAIHPGFVLNGQKVIVY